VMESPSTSLLCLLGLRSAPDYEIATRLLAALGMGGVSKEKRKQSSNDAAGGSLNKCTRHFQT
jgi:hypothetical protein